MNRMLAGPILCAVCVLLLAVAASSPAATAQPQERLQPPTWQPNEDWDSMKVIMEEQRAFIERGRPALVKKAAEILWLTFHMSGIAILPTPNVEETLAMHRMHIQELQKTIGVIQDALAKRQDLPEDILAFLNDVKVSFEADVDLLQTVGKWTATVPPGSPAAKQLVSRQLRSPFIPFPTPRTSEPQETVKHDVVGPGQCMVVVKEIHGLKVRLVAEIIPIWVEPWFSRRRIVGYKIVWHLEYVPAEFIKRIESCNRNLEIITRTDIEIKAEPELLDFWQFYKKDP